MRSIHKVTHPLYKTSKKMKTVQQIAEGNKFLQGYACCLACFINYEGGIQAIHKEAYGACFGNMTEHQLIKTGIEQSDIDLFKEHKLLTNK